MTERSTKKQNPAKAAPPTSSAPSLDQLALDEVGWSIPVDSLRWWVLGMAAPGPYARLDLDENGHILAIQQHGWDINFVRYRTFGNLDIPGNFRVNIDRLS